MKSERLIKLENELAAMGYTLSREFVIRNYFGQIKNKRPLLSLADVDRFVAGEEQWRLGNAGEAIES